MVYLCRADVAQFHVMMRAVTCWKQQCIFLTISVRNSCSVHVETFVAAI